MRKMLDANRVRDSVSKIKRRHDDKESASK